MPRHITKPELMNEYEQRAYDFLQETGTKISIEYETTVDGFPNSDDVLPHRKYNVTLKRGKRKFSYPFYDSYSNFRLKKDPSLYDILACLQTYEPESDMWEFARNYGYTINSEESYENVKNIFHAVWKEYYGLSELYEPEWLERLGEIQ